MYKQRISISINSKADREKIFDEFETLLGNLCKTGQIQGRYEEGYFTENEIICYQTTLEKNSLSKSFNDIYVSRRLKNLENLCGAKLKTEIVGESIPEYKPVCKCKGHQFYILFTGAFFGTSPIECGKCSGVIPIYRLKELTHDDRYLLISWDTNYKACDELQLGCSVGERWATKQMSDPNSQLSKDGLEVCNRIKKASGVTTFYYLHNYRNISVNKDKTRKCPSCNKAWLLKERLNNFYDYKCDKCELISSLTSNLRLNIS